MNWQVNCQSGALQRRKRRIVLDENTINDPALEERNIKSLFPTTSEACETGIPRLGKPTLAVPGIIFPGVLSWSV